MVFTRKWIQVALLVVPLVFAGCGRVTLDLAGGGRSVYIPVDRLPKGMDFQYVPSAAESSFRLHMRAHWIFWVLPLNHPDWEKETKVLLGESQGLGNLVIQTRTGPLDVLVGLVTLGFYRTTEITITGDRIRLVETPPGQ